MQTGQYRKGLKLNVAIISINNLQQISDVYSADEKDAAVKKIMECISQSIGEVSIVYRISENIFICLSDMDIRGYASQFRDLVSFTEVNEKYPLDVSVRCERWM